MDPTTATEPHPSLSTAQEGEYERKLPIRTYHCRFCSHLLIASTRELLSPSTPLRRRRRRLEGGSADAAEGDGGLDGALILELPYKNAGSHMKRRIADGGDESNGEVKKMAAGAGAGAGAGADKVEAQEETTATRGKRTEQSHYTIPLSTLVPDPTPVVIRREDGFEKRVLLRCGRCRVVVGYKLPSESTTAPGTAVDQDIAEDEDEDEDGIGPSKGRKGERALYLLPGSIVGTEDLDVGLTGGEGGEGGDGLNAMIERNPVLKGMEREWMEWVK